MQGLSQYLFLRLFGSFDGRHRALMLLSRCTWAILLQIDITAFLSFRILRISQSFLGDFSEENSFRRNARHEKGLGCWRRARSGALWRCVCWRLRTSRSRGGRPPTCDKASIVTTRDAGSAAQERSVGVQWTGCGCVGASWGGKLWCPILGIRVRNDGSFCLAGGSMPGPSGWGTFGCQLLGAL